MGLRTGDVIMGLFKKVPGWKNLSEEELVLLKKQLTSISKDFVDFCERHNINYMMGAGTALGAIRHHGFIPWDDDIDFHVPRKDYNKILELAPKELGDKYLIISPSTHQVSFPSIHMILRGSRYKNYVDLVTPDDMQDSDRGIYIDIIPYDNMSNIKILRDVKEAIMLLLHFLMSCIFVHKCNNYFHKIGLVLSKEELRALLFKNIIGFLCSFFSYQRWNRIVDNIASSNKNDESLWVTCFIGRKFHKYTHLRKDLWGENRAVFEGYSWKVATNIEKYLSQEYSKDYMTPPPVNKRKIHPVFDFFI